MSTQISYFSKEKTKCPACDSSFAKENFFTGRGRLNAKEVDNDLRRIYEPSKKFGAIYPLIYNIMVCPQCWFAALAEDFLNKKPVFDFEKVKHNLEARKKEVNKIVTNLSFTKKRDLYSGLASYFLAISCYHDYLIESQRAIKQALFSLRAGWVIDDILKTPEIQDTDKFSRLKEYFRFFSLQKIENYFTKVHFAKKKKFIEISYHGPDLDHDYGYDGLVYIYAYLGYEFIELESNLDDKLKKLEEIKVMLGKIFGFGKASKSKPSPLLDKSKVFYEMLKEKTKSLEEEKNSLNL